MQSTDQQIQIKEEKPNKTLFSSKFLPAAAVLACLIILEFVAFGVCLKKLGFYLDDWVTCDLLQNTPHAFLPRCLHYWLHDARKIIRPLEALLYASLYSCFGIKPLGYHIFLSVTDVINSFLLFKIVRRHTRLITAAIAAIVFLLLPIHDSTHYWLGNIDIAPSLTFCLLSYLFADKFAVDGSRRYFFASVATFAASIFEFECFLPLCAVNVVRVFAARKQLPDKNGLKSSGLLAACYGVCIAALVAYQRLVAPHLGASMQHPISFDPANVAATYVHGFQIALLYGAVPFFAQQIPIMLPSGLSRSQTTLLIVGILSVLSLGLYLHRAEKKKIERRALLYMALTGVAIIVLSYTIFALNSEYQPILITLNNRVNVGASIGTALIITALLEWIFSAIKGRTVKRGIIATAILIPSLGALLITNWALSVPWIQSATAQNNTAKLIKSHAGELHNGDCVILVNCPRYDNWSPVFDGVWDFRSMLHVVLNNHSIDGDVVSERMLVKSDCIEDVVFGLIIAKCSYQHMYVFLPQGNLLVPIHNRQEFVDFVSKNGMTFGLDKNIVAHWSAGLEN